LADIPCIIIAGAPGTGKSNLLHQFLLTLLFKKHPSGLKLLLADYKGVELGAYSLITNHFLAKLPNEEEAIISDPHKLVRYLNALCIEMDTRYELLREAGVTHKKDYNTKFIQRKLNPQKGHQYLPAIVLVIDNLDGFSTIMGKDVILPLERLVKLGYKAGISIIFSISELSYKALPGSLLSLISERISFRLHSKEDYRKLFETTKVEASYEAGHFHYNYQGRVLDGHTALITQDVIESVVDFIGKQDGYPHAFLLPDYLDAKNLDGQEFDLSDRDSLFEDAARLIVQNQVGSTSLIQRRMKLGYNRAGRLMEQLEAAGIVGPNQGSMAREVLIKTETDLQLHLDALGY